MKKMVAIALAMAMLVAMTVSASATVNFEFWAQCQNESNTDLQTDRSAVEFKNSGIKGVYVKHWVYGGSNDYTIFFRAYPDETPSKFLGQKWCTVNVNVPIQSNSIVTGDFYGVAGRGNSKHYLNDGNYRVSLHGNLNVNL